jgi:SAM-dependent methyltransferase
MTRPARPSAPAVRTLEESFAAPRGSSSGNSVWRRASGTFLAALALALGLWAGEPAAASSAHYEYRAPSGPEGTGKFYCGREIAPVMSHAGADWLERPEREAEEAPDRVLAALELQPGLVVADLGAGTGYYTRRLARAVGPAGRVYAVDIQAEMLEHLRRHLAAGGLSNVVTVLGTETDPRLPVAGVDLVLMVDVYHELAWPHEMLAALCRALKPGGRLVFVEYRAEDPAVPIKPLHKMTEAQIRREAAGHPLAWERTVSTLPWQHLVVFRKAETTGTGPDATPPTAAPGRAP